MYRIKILILKRNIQVFFFNFVAFDDGELIEGNLKFSKN